MATNADVVSVQQERVRPKLPELFETSDFLMARVKSNAEVETVSTRDYRIPILISYGGDFGTFNPDGGDYGLGSGPLTKHYVTSYFPTKQALQLTNLQMYATAKSQQAIKKAFALAMAGALKTYQANEDGSFHVSNGVVGIATATGTVGGKTQYTLDTTFATQLLRRQMVVEVYSNDLSSQYAGGPYRVEAIDIAGNKVTLHTTVTGTPLANDKLLFAGVSGASPSWKKGLPDFINTLTTGTLMTLDRATYPEIQSNWVDGTAGLSGVFGMNLLDLIEQRRDKLPNLTAVMHMKQRALWYAEGMAIAEWQRTTPVANQPLDTVPKRQQNFSFAGIPAVTDKHQNRTQILVLDFSRWGRAVLKDLDWLKVGNNTVFPLRGTSGGIAAGILSYLEMHSDWYTDDPGCQGVIHSLPLS